jgi:hypothetical protein
LFFGGTSFFGVGLVWFLSSLTMIIPSADLSLLPLRTNWLSCLQSSSQLDGGDERRLAVPASPPSMTESENCH